jgi:hypothetical protein
LIVEVKAGAEIHYWDLADGRLYQPDAYLRSWLDNYDPAREARVRRIATLTGPPRRLARAVALPGDRSPMGGRRRYVARPA